MKQNSQRKTRPTRKSEKKDKPLNPQAVSQALGALFTHQKALQSRIVPPPRGTSTAAPPMMMMSDNEMLEHGQRAYVAIRKLLNAEAKAVYGNFAGQALNHTWQHYNLTALITQGVTDSQRTGDAIDLKELCVNYQAGRTADAPGLSAFRIVITRSIDEALVASDVFDSLVGSTPLNVLAQYTWDQRKQYVVLYDSTHDLTLYTPVTGGIVGLTVSKQAHLKLNSHVQYQETTTTAEKGCIQMWYSTSTSSNTDVYLNVTARMTYNDM